MQFPLRSIVPVVAIVVVAGVGCPLCGAGPQLAAAQGAAAATGVPRQSSGKPAAHDTATARLHISGMTCASCPVTARLALRRIPGGYTAVVTLDDSLGVVKYDRARVSPPQIAAQLAGLTDYRATVLADSAIRRR